MNKVDANGDEIMSDIQRITWHYVMDIHEPENYWYSISRIVIG